MEKKSELYAREQFARIFVREIRWFYYEIYSALTKANTSLLSSHLSD